ncbi:unnamed protein product [Orchesella dallaii]|uniref:Coiled-coil domain-containing protein 108 n=1 Tax=Orchesella dallaii TaxID=48710 RepID=A0ABP1QH84_9HEXA
MIPKLNYSAMYKADMGITFNLQDNCMVGLYGYCEIPYLGIRVLYESSARGNEVVCPITIAGCITYTYVELQNPTGFHYRFWIEPADVEEEDWMIISPRPSSGFIAPNETIPISWKFAPRTDGMYYLFWRFCFDVHRTCSPKDDTLGYYEFIIPFTGVAKTSYLKADPSNLDFDMIQIFDTKSKTTVVRNDGECPVNAHFILHHEQWLTNFPPEIVSIHPTRVQLKPQESASVTVTVRPSRMNLQHFYVIYNLEFNDDDEFVQGVLMDVFEKHLIDITFLGDHTTFKFTDILMDSPWSIWDAQQCWSMFSLSLLNQLLTPYHHTVPEGTVPQVSSIAFRFPPAPINSAPYVFKLHLSNVSELRGFWAVFTKPPKGWKRHLQQKICGTCGTSEFKDDHFADSPDLASQIWARKFNYNAANDKKFPPTCNTRKDLSFFEITPTSGSLKSKESQVISIKYSFGTIGVHQVSVLLRIFPAIFVWIDLTGRTLDVHQPHIQLMNKKHMSLHPVCLSDMDPPVQMFWLYNGGNTVASFTVDLEPFEKVKDENFGHAVMECLTPKGDVQPQSWFPIRLKFSPLEYTHYMAPLIIYPSFDKTQLQAILYGSAAMNCSVSLRPAATTETVRKFVLVDSGVPVTLSPSHVTIGHLIPTGHSVSRVVFLTNIHARNTMKYTWQNVPIEGGGMISFHPNFGRLAPKEEASCKIIIQAGDTPVVLSTMIACTIEDETATVIYEFVLNQWRDYMKNTQLRDSEQCSNEVAHKPEKPEIYNRLLAVSLYIGSVFGQYDNIHSKEKSRIGFVAPLKRDQDLSIESLTRLPFTFTGSRFCQSIICDMIWDMIQSQSFASFIRVATKRKAPLFEEYADAEMNNVLDAESNESQQEQTVIPLHSTSEILEKSVFNIMHEMAERYAHASTRNKWFDIPPVQPKAMVDVEKHRNLFT